MNVKTLSDNAVLLTAKKLRDFCAVNITPYKACPCPFAVGSGCGLVSLVPRDWVVPEKKTEVDPS